jgi:drug/metabolite transporter (DMT)-like permease
VIVLGTLLPYVLYMAALRHLTAATAGVVGMLEPVVATVVAWAWLGQSLVAVQVVGGVVVLAGVGLAQRAAAGATPPGATRRGGARGDEERPPAAA